MIDALLAWIDNRTGLVTAVRGFFDEDIPASSGWHQVFGSVALFLLMIQFLTGVLLAVNYAPQPGESYYSLKYIIEEVTAGALMRGLHHWGASMMVVIVVLHMIQVAIWGAYKKPREVTWMAGVLLLLLVMGFGLTGYLLPWDNKSYWATVVTIQISGLAPGGELVQQLMGSTDGTVGVATFSRFYTLHTVVLPAITALLAFFHVYLVRRHGVAPQVGDESLPKKKFYPGQVFKDTAAVFLAFCVLFGMAAMLEAPLGRLADPTDTSFVPRPEWYFLFLFQTLKFFEGPLEVVGAVVLPTIAILLLIVVPFLDRSRLKQVSKRIPAMAVVVVAGALWAGLTTAALLSSPPERPAEEIAAGAAGGWAELTPVELAGQACFRAERCAECHNIAPGDPKIGPNLAGVAQRRDAEWMNEHFRDPSAVVPGSPMPPLQLSDNLLNCLSAFLLSVTPANVAEVEQAPEWATRGAMLYQMNECGSCHVVNGQGVEFGPALNGVGQRHDRDWIVGHFQDPQAFSEGSMMPVYEFSEQELDAIVQYLQALPAQ